jgi:HPt (histidine-containing phosphotransfer) domain-containing protein
MISPYESSFGPPLDSEVLDELRQEMGGSGSSDFMEAVATYLEDAALHLAAIQEAVLSGETERLLQAIHTLKGTSSYFGAHRMQALCLEIESLVRGNAGDMAGCATELQKEFSRVRHSLEEEGSDGPA